MFSTFRFCVLVAVAVFPFFAHGQGLEPELSSAWDELVLMRPEMAEGVSRVERSVLKALSMEQLTAYLEGTPEGEIQLEDGRTLAELLADLLKTAAVCGDPGTLFCSNFETRAVDDWSSTAGYIPPPITLRSSPFDGEADVAVTRETVIELSAPLAEDTALDHTAFYAEFGGQRLSARVHVAPTRDRVTLFYDNGLPASARVRVSVVGDLLEGEAGQSVDADGDGEAGGTARIDFDTLSLTTVPNTLVCGRVFASEQEMNGSTPMDVPLAGVTITVDGQESVLFTTTDSMGNFCLDPAPAGRFFVHIDGRTASNSVPLGAYYPFVGKSWESIVGQQADIGDVYLPLIVAGTLQDVSMSEDTEIEFPQEVIDQNPELEGAMLRVPADSLFADNGTRGGQVGIAPVAPDRLPGSLPPGLNFPLVITVQTDGATNFDQPVEVCFPNLPDPITGEALAPGEKSALWSFNHDTGRFEVVGPMTVTADGSLVCSDEGFGVRAPGWHGVQPGTPVTDNMPPVEPEEEDPNEWANNGSGPDAPDTPYNSQFDCLNSTACDNRSGDPDQPGWADRFPKYLFDYIERQGHRSSQISCPPSLILRDWACLSLVGTIHVFQELAPGFASYCREIRQSGNYEELRDQWAEDHERFLDETISPCYQNLVNDGEVESWALWMPSSIRFSASVLRKGIVKACDHGLLDSPDENLLFGGGEGPPQLPPPLGEEDLFSLELAQLSSLDVQTGGTFFVDVGSEIQLSVFRGGVDVTFAQQTEYFLAVEDDVATISPNGLLSIVGGSLPLASDRQVLYVTVTNGEDFGIGQFAIVAPDTDGDYITDPYEESVGLDPLTPRPFDFDSDGDGLTDITEVLLGTAPLSADTDGDGIDDETEVRLRTGVLNPSLGGLNPRRSQQYYAFEDLSSGFVIRGQTGPNGRIQDVVLSPDTAYRVWVFQPEGSLGGSAPFTSASTGFRTELPIIILETLTLDSDGDLLADLGEFVIGTAADNPDTDGDGILDGAEVEQGLDPLDDVPSTTGIVASADTPGTAIDVCALNDLAVVADSSAGISVFNVFSGLNPTIIAQVDTPGSAQAVTCAPDVVAVADGSAGLAIVDITDPPAAFIAYQVPLTGSAQTVTAQGNIVYAGTNTGHLSVIDMSSGNVLETLAFAQSIDDLRVVEDKLYVLTRSDLLIYNAALSGLQQLGSIPIAGSVSPLETGRKLFVGHNYAYVGYFTGYSVIDITDPFTPLVVGSPPATQSAIHDLASNGSGLLVATTSFAGSGTLAVSLYDISDPTDVTRFLTSFETPGASRAVSVFNGLAYVADSSAGLQVVNYLPYDNQGVPPTLELTTNFVDDLAEEGKLMRLTADVSDDVQVRNVEFFVDGVSRARDGSFPFEYRFITPLLGEQSTFTIRARATDTGGNVVETVETVITLTPDATPPQVVNTSPRDGSSSQPGTVSILSVTFSEPIDASLLDEGTFQLVSAGADGLLETADDVGVEGSVSYQEEAQTGLLTLAAPLPVNQYRATVSGGLEDLSGNTLTGDFEWTFSVVEGTIRSRLTGGDWSDVDTWTAGRLPNAADIVAIRGIVTLDTFATVSGLMVGAGSTLQEGSTSRSLTVTERTANDGSLLGSRLDLRAQGDIVNNGVWTSRLSLSGTQPRSIVGLEPIAGEVILEGNLAITNDAVFAGPLGMNGYTLTLTAPRVVTFGGIESSGSIAGGGTLRLAGDVIEIDNFPAVTGNVELGAGTTLQNGSSSRSLSVYGHFTNRGTVRDNPATGSFEVSVVGSLEQFGLWQSTVSLTGSLEILNDAIFDAPLDLSGYTLTLASPTVATFNGIESSGTVAGGGTLRLGGDLVEIDNFPVVTGNVEVASGTILQNNSSSKSLTVYGTFTNQGTIRHNPGGGTFTLSSEGNVINNGSWTSRAGLVGSASRTITGSAIAGEVILEGSFAITNDAVFGGPIDMNGYTLTLTAPRVVTFGGIESSGSIAGGGTLRLAGDIIEIDNFPAVTGNVELGAGTTLQNFSSSRSLSVYGHFTNRGTVRDNPATGSFEVSVVGSLEQFGLWQSTVSLAGSLEILNDAIFDAPLDLSAYTLTLASPTVATFSGIESSGSVAGGGTIRLGGDLIEIDNFPVVTGNVELVSGTILQNESSSRSLTVYGTFTNQGTIRHNPGGGTFTLSSEGNVINNGSWTSRAGLTGSAPRTITGSAAIAGEVILEGSFAITNDAVFAGPVDMNAYTLTLAAPRVVTFGGIESSGSIAGGGTLRLAADVIEIDNFPVVTGNVEVAAATIVQNEVGSSRGLTIDGDLTNYGNIRHHPGGGTLTLEVSGTLTNHGTITATIP